MHGQLRAPEQVALTLAAVFAAEYGEFILRLYALGKHRNSERLTESHDGADDGACLAAAHQLGDEEAVEFDFIKRQVAERFEGGIASTKIIQCNRYADGSDLPQHLSGEPVTAKVFSDFWT